MAAMIPEAVEAAGAGEAGAGTGAAYRGRHRAPPSRKAPGPRVAAVRDQAARRERAVRFGRERGQEALSASLPGGREYQGVILAEFVGAVLLVSVSPLVNPPQDGKDSPSPYRVSDMKQLLALGVVYFILALLSSGRRGKLAAGFGGLILLGLALSQFASGKLAGTLQFFASPAAGEGAVGGGAAGEGSAGSAAQAVQAA